MPGDQDRLIEEVAAVNPNTIVVLNTSQPIAMPWLHLVKAVVQMWWPGDEGGWATAKVLLGKANPAGRLPMTWAKKLSDYAPHDPAHPERSDAGVEGKTTYSEGVLVGYRWFDAQKIEPLYPFGYGLSYTQFSYSDMSVHAFPDGSAEVNVRIKNIGRVTGDEVPQVYLDAPEQPISGIQFAHRTLVAFDRLTLKSGESRVVALHISPRAFEYWSVDQKRWLRPSASRTIHVGTSSRDLRLSAALDYTRSPQENDREYLSSIALFCCRCHVGASIAPSGPDLC
ncbi:MAG: glycoside hydrolase family 3 C-terminal domain-containing protein [Edaphobacter sp.]